MKLSSIKLLFFVHQLFLGSFIVGAANVQHVDDGNGSVNLDGFNNGTVGHFDHELFGVEHRLLAEEKNDAAEDVNQNVHFVKPGKVNLTLKYNDQLTFQVCSNCTEYVHICYESSEPDGNLKGDCRESSQCSLQIYGQPTDYNKPVIWFGPVAASFPKPSPTVCDTIEITGKPSKFQTVVTIETCKPKIENGMIRLDIIKADGNKCYVKAMNANVKLPEIIATPSPSETSVKPTNLTDTSNSGTSESSFPWWLILIICIILLAVGIGIGIAVHFWCKQRRSSKASEVSSQPPLVVVTGIDANKEATVTKIIQAPSKQDAIVAAAKPEPSQSKEPEKPEATLSNEPAKKPIEDKKKPKAPEKKKKVAEKNTTIEPPTTTEEIAAPPKPTRRPGNYGCPTPHIVPRSRSSKIRKTSSVEDAIERNMSTATESVPDSLLHNSLMPKDMHVVEQMKKTYPEVYKRDICESEILLFCVAISQMFSFLNDMAGEYEETLVGLGVHFDGAHQIVTMTPEARKYLKDQSTPGTCVLFAFGAEFHQYLKDDVEMMNKLSVPHLMTISLQPRFSEYSRRKACTHMRRVLPYIRANYTVAEREALPFPVSMIEDSFEENPKYLLDTSGIDTDSERDRRRNAEAQKEFLKQKKKAEGRGGDAQKRKKKSSKKRQL